MDSADSFMNWGFNPKGRSDAEDIIFIYSTMYVYEDWWDTSVHKPGIDWTLEEALNRIGRIIVWKLEESLDHYWEGMEDDHFWNPMDYNFRQIPPFELKTNYTHYLPQRNYPQYWDENGDFTPWDLNLSEEADDDFINGYGVILGKDIQLWKEEVLEYNRDHPLQISKSKPYQNWIFSFIKESEYENDQGRMFIQEKNP